MPSATCSGVKLLSDELAFVLVAITIVVWKTFYKTGALQPVIYKKKKIRKRG
jgi:hypothetical protein